MPDRQQEDIDALLGHALADAVESVEVLMLVVVTSPRQCARERSRESGHGAT